MTLSVDLFYSFRSPYSYLALTRTVKMVADCDVVANLRPVYPLARTRGKTEANAKSAALTRRK